MNRRTVKLDIEVWLDDVEALAEHGPVVLRLLEAAISKAKRIANSKIREQDQARRDRARKILLEKFYGDGRKYHRELRRQIKLIPDNLLGRSRANARQDIVYQIASENGVSRELVALSIRRHRDGLNRQIRERKKFKVLSYHLSGIESAEIADLLGVQSNTVYVYLRELKAEADRQNLSLIQLSQLRAEDTLVDRAISRGDETIVRWDDAKKSQGASR